MSQLDDDLLAIAADPLMTVPVVFGAQSARGWFDVGVGTRNDDPYSSASRAGRTVSVRIRAAALSGLGIEMNITVDGRAYRIIDLADEDDGMVVRIDMQRVVA